MKETASKNLKRFFPKMEAQLDASNEFEKEMDLELESRLKAAETSGGIRQQDRVGGLKI